MSGKISRNRSESDLKFMLTRPIIRSSVPQSLQACSMACAARADLHEDIEISYDLTTGDVVAVWQQTEAGRLRNYSGIVEPNKTAMQILMGTDLDKDRLVRLCPDEGWELTITRCESRFKQDWGSRSEASKSREKQVRGTSSNRKPRRFSSRAGRVPPGA